ncbi:type I-B CRISPR-associated protein Cas7/Cst2/DevR [Candidatus Poribacteria bacterium]|nr:type I-B CRISPR-associated protein Cas7/Cst2/DevR [Candidatus Poribacteria bacterium]
MSKHLIGLTIIDAPYSALNNAGTEASQATENIVTVKKLQKGRDTYPYVSGQAWRNWWRTTLEHEFDEWNSSPIEREKKIAFTAADPVSYDDDDVFGYMRAQSDTQDGKKVNLTVTRLSPLKCSPLISIAPQTPTNDFGVMARQEGNPVPYEHQFYSCVLQGIFSLDLSAVGAFSDVNRTGYKNISSSYVETIQNAGGTQEDEKAPWVLPKEIRVRRCQQTLEALPILSGGAKLTSHLTDVTPKLIILSVLDGGNHPFMNLMVEENGEGKLSINALREVIRDYGDRFCDSIYIGRRSGFMDELDEDLCKLDNDIDLSCEIVYDSPNRVIAELSQRLETHIGDAS